MSSKTIGFIEPVAAGCSADMQYFACTRLLSRQFELSSNSLNTAVGLAIIYFEVN